MSHLHNLQRDQFHSDFAVQNLAYSTSSGLGTIINGNSDGTVYKDAKTARATGLATNVAGNWSSIGILMEPPAEESIPYRVKAYVNTSGPKEWFVVAGEGPVSPTGTDDVINPVLSFPVGVDGKFDEVLLVPKSNNAVYIGIAVGESAGLRSTASISVQRLSVASPQFSSAVA